MSSVACLTLSYFSTLSHERCDFRNKRVIDHKCVLIFSKILSEIFLLLRIIYRDVFINMYRYSCIVFVILVRFKWNLNFFNSFSKNNRIILIKILPWSRVFSSGQTEGCKDGQKYVHDEARNRVSQFFQRKKNYQVVYIFRHHNVTVLQSYFWTCTVPINLWTKNSYQSFLGLLCFLCVCMYVCVLSISSCKLRRIIFLLVL
jgi:hypothetical protein